MDIHGNHHLQQQQQQPPPPTHKSLVDQDLKRRPLVPVSFPNGTLKKHRPLYPPPPPGQHLGNGGSHVVYRECMKNHAASLGGHALDGCGEFMPSPDASPADPASLTCAACGCHRNFHRRVLHGAGAADHQQHLYHPQREEREVDDRAGEEEDGDEAVDEEEGEEGHGSPRPQQSQPAPHQFYSAPHMLMALSAGGPVGASGPLPVAVGAGCSLLPRKRFRSKFSQEQKERMHDLSERLGWRMQKRDDALVEDCCREIGVTRGVFKVWMHNNKHNFVGGPSSRRASGGVGAAAGGGGGGGVATSSNGGGGVVGVGLGITAAAAARVNGGDEQNGVGSNGGGGGGGSHVMNGSSSPSS